MAPPSCSATTSVLPSRVEKMEKRGDEGNKKERLFFIASRIVRDAIVCFFGTEDDGLILMLN
uniref:Uncharacterized protein n=1 Tax=Lotus japonicus TaxID=34305 RepID=I3SXD1_LOTJA|nr:unknown [Lotus japonicus]